MSKTCLMYFNNKSVRFCEDDVKTGYLSEWEVVCDGCQASRTIHDVSSEMNIDKQTTEVPNYVPAQLLVLCDQQGLTKSIPAWECTQCGCKSFKAHILQCIKEKENG